ncbi:hypothetical protein N9F41_00145 [bacterium]|nr:hypothetical protein [bacterium]
MSNGIWEFTLKAAKMGNTTNLFFKTLPKSGFSNEEILVREALQNCRDARSDQAVDSGLASMVSLKKRSIEGDELVRFSETLQFSDALGRSEYLKGYTEKDLQKIIDGKRSVSVLEVEDKNTKGLGGVWDGDGPEDNFSRLVVNLGASLKADGGGSFGFGKTVFASQSRLKLVIYYSVFEPTKESEGNSARLMGVWLMQPHKQGGKAYDGFVFFGKSDSNDPKVAIPFVDDEAHEIAKKLGIKPRSSREKGTTVLVFDCDLNMEKVRDAVERYWWPSLTHNTLAVKVSNNDQKLRVRPKENPRVSPFITCYNDLDSNPPSVKSSVINEASGSKARKFRGMKNLEIGFWIENRLTDLQVTKWIEKEKEHKGDDSEEDTGLTAGGIARIRDSGMVVSYDCDAISMSSPCVAIFRASSDIDQYLRISEPQTHDRWDSQADRLDEEEHFENFEKGLGKKIVNSVNKRIKDAIHDFQKNAADPPPPPEYVLKGLDSQMAKLVNSGNVQGGVEPGSPRPISLSVKESKEVINNRFELNADIEIALNDDYPEDAVSRELVVRLNLLGDLAGSVLEILNCVVTDSQGNQSDFDDKIGAVIPIVLRKGTKEKFRATGYYTKGYKTEYIVKVP